MLSAQNLNFHYDSHQVLYNINVELPNGSITGLIGPNGAGKSTLMRCMAGLECPSSGEVRLNGKPILANPRESFAQLARRLIRYPMLNLCGKIARRIRWRFGARAGQHGAAFGAVGQAV